MYAEHLLYFFNRCLHVAPNLLRPAWLSDRQDDQGRQAESAAGREPEDLPEPDLERSRRGRLRDRGKSRHRPGSVMEDMIKGLHIGHVFCLLHNGNQPDWKTRYSSKLFAEKVMPALRDIWPEYKDDDRWWIKPYEGRVRPRRTCPARSRADERAHHRDALRASSPDSSRRVRVHLSSISTERVGSTRTSPCSKPWPPAIGSTRPSGPATESPAVKSCSRTCSTSRYTDGTSWRLSGWNVSICWGTPWAA